MAKYDSRKDGEIKARFGADKLVLEIFHDSKEFYTLKELERLGPKLKGITQQTVKETLDDLVGDGLVMFDKIGTSNCRDIADLSDFWAFPSAAGAAKQAAVDKANKELESVQARIAQVQIALAAAQKGKEDTAERKKLLSTLAAARETNVGLKGELAAYGAADPVKYEKKGRAIEVCKESALRWTDNAVSAMQYGRMACQIENEQWQAITGIDDIDEWEDLKL